MKRSKKIVALIVMMCLYLSTFGQKADYYYDFNVDHYPRIVTLKIDSEQSTQLTTMVQGEFIETLNMITKEIFGKGKYLERISGFTMMSSGICPPQIREAEKWIKLEIDKSGKVNNVEVYQNVVEINKEVSDLFSKILETAKINPALKEMEPVNIRLYYILLSN